MATILVADDDQLLRVILRDQLERSGHSVVEAGDGMAAMSIALDERPDVLVLDVMMPLARGLEVVRRVRRHQDQHPVILMISARTRVTDRLNAMEAGADGYFEKPFAPDELVQAIERLTVEAAAPRYIDVLGPLWATLAIGRLADDALAHRPPGPSRDAQAERLFSRLVTSGMGRMSWSTSPYESHARPTRFRWGDAVRALLRDSVEVGPGVIEVPLPDALAAVGRARDDSLRDHRTRHEPPGTLPGFWYDAITRASITSGHDATPGPGQDQRTLRRWGGRLRLVLDAHDTSDAIVRHWREALHGVLAVAGAGGAGPTADPRDRVRTPAAGLGTGR